jgi:hypothetical protein
MPATDQSDRLNPVPADKAMQLSALGPSGIPAKVQMATNMSHCSQVIFSRLPSSLTLGTGGENDKKRSHCHGCAKRL